MSYSTGIAVRANLMEKDRSGGIRLARSPPGMWGGGRSLHSQSGKEKHPRYAQGLVRGRTGCPKWVLFSSTPHHKLPRQVMWELRVIFHLIEKQLTNPPKKPTNHWLNYHLKRKGKKKRKGTCRLEASQKSKQRPPHHPDSFHFSVLFPKLLREWSQCLCLYNLAW